MINVASITDVSVSSLGIEGNGDSEQSVISANGSTVAFLSFASNLVANDLSNNRPDVYSDQNINQNQNTNQTADLSNNIAGLTGGSFAKSSLSISGDGHYVVFFDNVQTNSGGSSSNTNVFVADQNSHTVNEIASGVDPTISTDGQTVVFETVSQNSQTNQPIIEVAGINGQILGSISGNAGLTSPTVSADGNYVAFYGTATQLTTDGGASLQLDASQPRDAFVYDRATNTLTLISKGLNGADANGGSGALAADGNSQTVSPMSISANGQYIAFESSASNLVANDQNTNGRVDIFVYNTINQTIERVSVAANGGDPDGSSTNPSISANGQYVAFSSFADNLVAGDTNGVADIFVYDLLTNTTTRVSVAADGSQANGASGAPQISADGTHVTFTTAATNLFPADTNGNYDVVVAALTQITSVLQENLGLYAALYNRAAEAPGYSYWVGIDGQQPDAGGVTVANAGTTAVTLNDAQLLGQAFVNTQSTFFNATYASLNDSAFINALYVNIGGNAGDPSGITYWANLLAQAEAGGQSVQAARAGLAGQFVHDLIDVNLAAFTGLTTAQYQAALQRQETINNKIAVSLAYSTASQQPGGAILDPQTIGDAAYQAATTILQGVTYDPATVTAAITGINAAVAAQNLHLI